MPYKNIEDRREAGKRYYEIHKDSKLRRQKLIREENIEKFRENAKAYYKQNKEVLKKQFSKHYQKYKDHYRKIHKQWREDNKERYAKYLKEYEKDRYANDVQYKIRKNCRSRMYHALRGVAEKSAGTVALLGCPIEKLKEHLQSQFTEGMSWDNYGEWHIDHIKPCASFDLTDPEQQKQCFHYTNLQPLWAGDNMRKGSILKEC